MIHLTIVEFACQALLGEMLSKYWAAITCRYSQNQNLKNHHLLFHRQKPGIISRPPTRSQSYDNPMNLGLLSPFTLSTTNPNASTITTSLGFSSAIDPIFAREFFEPELFEDDPCYLGNLDSLLLASVSGSLSNFQLDRGFDFFERSRSLTNVSSALSEVNNKPSPIESPMSREKLNKSVVDMHNSLPVDVDVDDDNANANEKGTWQM